LAVALRPQEGFAKLYDDASDTCSSLAFVNPIDAKESFLIGDFQLIRDVELLSDLGLTLACSIGTRAGILSLVLVRLLSVSPDSCIRGITFGIAAHEG
jgi:hypothetical protein